MIRNKLALLAGLALLSAGANAVTQQAGISAGVHTYMESGGSNGAAPTPTYGDGATSGTSPGNICLNAVASPFATCADAKATVTPAITAGQFFAGNNGTYWGNPTPVAVYNGAVVYDDAITFVDPVDSLTYFRVTGGVMDWSGTYGLEVSVTPGTSGQNGGSFFGYAFNNSGIDLTTGARQTTGGAAGVKSNCYLGAAGNFIVGSLLCGFANPVSSWQYSSVGTAYVKSANWAGVRFNGDGSVGHLLLTSSRFTSSGAGNNIREELDFSVVPVPAAVWLFGSALGVMGVVRRKKAAATV